MDADSKIGRPDLAEAATGQGTVAPVEFGFIDLLTAIVQCWGRILVWSLGAGLMALAATYLVKPTYTARTSFLPPQPAQSGAAAALASLGALANLAGGANARTPADQYVALLTSVTVRDRLIDQFKLGDVYEKKLRADVMEKLAGRVRVGVGRKDGLIAVEVDDHSPERAAAMANRHVDELRRLTGMLAITEAQQRRVFFEAQLGATRTKLAKAQTDLQASGFSDSNLRAEPRAAAEGFARLRAELTATEIRLEALRKVMTDQTPEVQRLSSVTTSLRAELARQRQVRPPDADPDYIGRYREFKYQETLFEMFSRQYELARLDEAREGTLIQVVDVATAPERKSHPRRGLIAVATTLVVGLLASMAAAIGAIGRSDPGFGAKLAALRAAFGRRDLRPR